MSKLFTDEQIAELERFFENKACDFNEDQNVYYYLSGLSDGLELSQMELVENKDGKK